MANSHDSAGPPSCATETPTITELADRLDAAWNVWSTATSADPEPAGFVSRRDLARQMLDQRPADLNEALIRAAAVADLLHDFARDAEAMHLKARDAVGDILTQARAAGLAVHPVVEWYSVTPTTDVGRVAE